MNTMAGSMIEYLNKRSKTFLFSMGFILVLFFGAIQYVTGPNISLFVLYLIPISIVAWVVGRQAVVLCIASSITWSLAHAVGTHTDLHLLVPLWDMAVSFGFFLVSTYVLSELKTALQKEKALARTDDLTKLLNRRAFYELAENEVFRSRRYGHPFTLAYMDLDNFKFVNDNLGHTKGDSVLRLLAEVLNDATRDTDIVARLGGDEFAVLMPETGYEAANLAIHRLRKRLEAVVQNDALPVTFSIGVVTFINPPNSVDKIIQKADGLMYSVKKMGKNRIMHELVDESASRSEPISEAGNVSSPPTSESKEFSPLPISNSQ